MQDNINNYDKDIQKGKDNSRSLWLRVVFFGYSNIKR